MSHLLEHRSSARGLNRTQAIILRILGRHPGLQAQDLRFPAGVEPANVSRTLQSLERMGLVRRQPHPTDGRASIFSLTEEGQATAEAIAMEMRELRDAVMDGVDPQELTVAEKVLDILWQNIRDQLTEAGFQPLPGQGPATPRVPKPTTMDHPDGSQNNGKSGDAPPSHQSRPPAELGMQGADRSS